jgi:hypothetical protein
MAAKCMLILGQLGKVLEQSRLEEGSYVRERAG